DTGLGLGQALQPLGDYAVVVGDQDADGVHGKEGQRGTTIRTVAPSPLALATATRAPTASARSRMALIPQRPRPAVAGSKPWPSSEIAITRSRSCRSRTISTVRALACFATLLSASCAMR